MLGPLGEAQQRDPDDRLRPPYGLVGWGLPDWKSGTLERSRANLNEYGNKKEELVPSKKKGFDLAPRL
jgi:hypothetical protein